jgi:hypothetical protein
MKKSLSAFIRIETPSSVNPFVTSGTCMSHLQWVLLSPLEWQYPTFSPCCHLPWSISILLNQSERIFPRNSRVQMILCPMLHAALHTVSFVRTRLFCGKMHSDWFNGIKILQRRWQHGEKVECCYPSGLEKTLCQWDIYVCPAGHERVKRKALLPLSVT